MTNRRDFFRSFVKPIKKEEVEYLHPPYFKELTDFEKCSECEEKKCADACEEKIIKIVDYKPILHFSESGCTFCDECANACELEVLSIENKKDIGKAKIDILKCIAWNKTVCSLCNDICDERAIKFYSFFNPEIDDNLCNGCGFCLNVCPTYAIEIKRGMA